MQNLEVQLEDDLTGGLANETIAFGVDGSNFEIDLNAAPPVGGRPGRSARCRRHRRRPGSSEVSLAARLSSVGAYRRKPNGLSTTDAVTGSAELRDMAGRKWACSRKTEHC